MDTTFDSLGLSERALAAVDDLGYKTPSPVQSQAIPLVLEGRDVIAAAKTGTGKTAAFSLPTIDQLDHVRRGQGPLMLVVTPTRELAMQIEEVCSTIVRHTGHHVACVVGGVSYTPQIKALKRGCDILVATPGRLIDLLDRKAVSLKQVATLVLDEADRMLDMGFLPDMKRIIAQTRDDRQTLLFSATIDSGIRNNMKMLLHNPAFVEIAHKGETADTVDQYIVRIDQRSKQPLLEALLKDKGSKRIIVFTRTRHRVDNCCKKLRQAGYKAAPIHSDRSQNQRKHALDAFARGSVDILVATDVLARGIDVSDVNYVVNFDLPTQAEDYVHRIGRTGRAGEHGFAVSFVAPDNKGDLKSIQKLIGKTIPSMTVKGFDASKSDAAIAAKATRSSAKHDPELAQAAKEYKNQSHKSRNGQGRRRKNNSNQHNGESNHNGGGKQRRRNGSNNSHSNNSHSNRSYNSNNKGSRGNKSNNRSHRSNDGQDFRPGRSQRAHRSEQHTQHSHQNNR
ncbi:MAG: DEAD/DEAH box helicase [Eggerthellaceae bacterium]|jgi:ATP-dependent RNA helicase RhlE|nr:DEAD/DEAH box helicase [Eggerthellaceae bacterium]MCH4220386.1 DEAD/DEAH box helicase [Eggerthellaceae bacterium]